jgi:predicted ferric reductase
MTTTRTPSLPAAPLAVTAATVMLVAGYATTLAFGPLQVGRMLPWVVGRGLGIAAYLSLVALTAAGLWLRHPWRLRWRRPAPQAQLRVHAALAGLTLTLLVGHIVALVLDSYAGVGWKGAVVPSASHYRPLAVALGTVSLYLGLLVGVSAALAGRLVRRAWLPVHRLASTVFALTWLHAMLAGSDTARLKWVYVVTGAALIALAVTRRVAASPAPEAVGGTR